MIAAAIATAACAVAVVLLVRAERQEDRRGRHRWKPLASAAFVALPLVAGAFAADRDHALAAWIVAGLVLGAIGDVALMFDSERSFLGGLVAFLFVLARSYASRRYGEEQATAAIVTSYYWHFVDVVWIVLFVLVYFIKYAPRTVRPSKF